MIAIQEVPKGQEELEKQEELDALDVIEVPEVKAMIASL